MDKKFTLEEVVKVAEMHNNGICDGTCPLESMEINCEDLFAEAVLDLNKKNENLSAENKQLQLTIERRDKRFVEVNNQLILERARHEAVEVEKTELECLFMQSQALRVTTLTSCKPISRRKSLSDLMRVETLR